MQIQNFRYGPGGLPAGLPQLMTVRMSRKHGTAAIPQNRLGVPRTALGIAVPP